MLDTEKLRAKAHEFTTQARGTENAADKERLTALAQSYLLLAKNAAWIHSTDKFVNAVRNGSRWPHP